MAPATEPVRHRWDDPQLPCEVLQTVLDTPRRPLHELDLTDLQGPGAYIMHMATTNPTIVATFSETIAHGRACWYVGSARRLGPRLRRYEQSLRDLADLGHTALWVTVIPTASHAAALFVEATAISLLDPLGNKIGGFGAKIPGNRRRTQTCSPLDALLPGRAWVRPPSPVDRIRALATVVAYLTALDPAGPRWAPLVQ